MTTDGKRRVDRAAAEAAPGSLGSIHRTRGHGTTFYTRDVPVFAAAACVFCVLAPFLEAWTHRGQIRGYYDCPGVVCGCGHSLFTYIDGDGYYDYVPGHGPSGLERIGTLHATPDGWTVTRDRDGVVAFHLRIRNGDVYNSGKSLTNWFKEERVYNPYRLWIPRVLSRVFE